MSTTTITAAGGLVWRKSAAGAGLEILLVHRPGYDDWSFPKGKPERDEPLPVTAVREITEETGYRVRLAHPLPRVDYRIKGGMKHVSYWICRLVGTETDFHPTREVDELRWCTPRQARKALSYEHDRDLLDTFVDRVEDKRHTTRTLVVLRHAKAVSRDRFDGPDEDRPLKDSGRRRAAELVPLLEAFGVRRVVTSPTTRTVQTVEPFVTTTGELLEIDDRVAAEVGAGAVARSVDALVATKRPTVVCTHRPTLPHVYAALGVDGPPLSPGRALVVHHRKGVVLATEVL